MKNNIILKILPHYIPVDQNQNMSIWSVAKQSILNSKFIKSFIIYSPPASKPLTIKDLKITYIDSALTFKNSLNEEIANGNINHNVDREKYTKAIIGKINEDLEHNNISLIEVEEDYRLAGIIAKTFSNIPVVLVAHTVFGKRKFIPKLIQYFNYLRHIKHIIFVSKAHLDIFNKKYPYAVKKNYVIHNSYAHISLIENNNSIKKNQIIFAGRASINKGYQEYLLSLTNILPTNPNWNALAILAVETLDVNNMLDNFINSNNDLQQLIQLGKLTIIKNLSNTELFNKFCESKIAVFPTHKSFAEGLPLVGIEAHLAKCAVICSENQGFKELSLNNALYLNYPITAEDISKKLKVLIEDTEMLDKLANNGYLHVKTQHDIKNLILLYDAIRENTNLMN
ncbi:glycosyltransferase family 4 protein [Rickettsiales bacterium LUAb2]